MPINDVQENGNTLWGCAIMEFYDGIIGDTVYNFEKDEYSSRENALQAMDAFVKYVVQTVKIMSN